MSLQKPRHFRKYPHLYVDDADRIRKGLNKGLFAGQDFKKNDEIFTLHGIEKVTSIPRNDYEATHWFQNGLAIGPFTWLMPGRNEPYRYINHSCSPNTGRKGLTTFVAMRNIKKDEQLTIDYATTTLDPFYLMPCVCGAKNCRKNIGSIHSIPNAQFRKYAGYIPELYLKYRTQGPVMPRKYGLRYGNHATRRPRIVRKRV